MNRGALFAAVLAVLLLTPATATAKGPTAASISGPGLSRPLLLRGFGESGDGSPLAVLTMDGGFFPAAFGQSPDPMLPGRPAADLGPRYVVVYTVPGPSDTDHIRQELFPYAEGGPVLYTAPNQPFFDSERTRGGWFRAPERLKAALVRAGLPDTPAAKGSAADVSQESSEQQASSAPGSGGGGGMNGGQIGMAAIAVALAAALAGTVVVRRRGRGPHPARREDA